MAKRGRRTRGWLTGALLAVVGLTVSACATGLAGSPTVDEAAQQALQSAMEDMARTTETPPTTPTTPTSPTSESTTSSVPTTSSESTSSSTPPPSEPPSNVEATGVVRVNPFTESSTTIDPALEVAEADCSEPSRSAITDSVFSCDLMPGTAAVCWPGSTPTEALCSVADPREETLFVVHTTEPLAAVSGNPDAEPWAMVLTDGSFCYRMTASTRAGMSTEGNLVAEYACHEHGLAGMGPGEAASDEPASDEPASDEADFVVYADRNTGKVTDRSGEVWSVQTGASGGAASSQTLFVQSAFFPAERTQGSEVDVPTTGDERGTDEGTRPEEPLCVSPDKITKDFTKAAWTRCFWGGFIVAGQYYADQAPDDYDGSFSVLKKGEDGAIELLAAGPDVASLTLDEPTITTYLEDPRIAIAPRNQFSTPDGNVHCRLQKSSVACSVEKYSAGLTSGMIEDAVGCDGKSLTEETSVAELGGVVVEGTTFPTIFCGSRGIDTGSAALPAGTFIQMGDIVCEPESDGSKIFCRRTDVSIHGFRLATSRVVMF